jgi:hypothetical protein
MKSGHYGTFTIVRHPSPSLVLLVSALSLLSLATSGHAEPRTRRLLKAGLTSVPDNVSPSPWYSSEYGKIKCSKRPLNLVFMMNPNPGEQA